MRKTSGYTMSIEKNETAPLAFFRYRQNNPRSVFHNTDRVGIVVIVEAASAAQADAMAVARTDGEVYFDGVHTHGDCRCCGERWSEAWGSGEPNLDEMLRAEFDSLHLDSDGRYMGVPYVVHVYRADGTHIKATKTAAQ